MLCLHNFFFQLPQHQNTTVYLGILLLAACYIKCNRGTPLSVERIITLSLCCKITLCAFGLGAPESVTEIHNKAGVVHSNKNTFKLEVKEHDASNYICFWKWGLK